MFSFDLVFYFLRYTQHPCGPQFTAGGRTFEVWQTSLWERVLAILNRLGYKTGQEKTWNASRVAGLRGYHKIAPFQKQDDWVTQEEAARELQVSDTVVKRLIRERVLPAKQVVKFAPWIIDKKNLLLPAVQQQVKAARRGGHRLPQIVLGQGQLSLE